MDNGEEEEELLRQIEDLRQDPKFRELAKRIIDQQQEVLDRLAET